MCDFSAEAADTRKAAVGDQLVTGEISRHATIGLVEKGGDPKVAVCLVQGTTLIFSGIPEADQQAWGVGEVATATFDQLTVDGAKLGTYYRDGVIFSGKNEHVCFQSFAAGIDVSVESLPNEALVDDTAHATRELVTA